MRKIAIIGGGQGGLLLGFGLIDKGYDVTLYSDRTAEQVLHARMASTAFMFESSLKLERELCLNFWEDLCPYGEGMHVDFRGPDGSVALSVQGRLGDNRGQALDQRTKFHRWMNEFSRRGGRLEIQSISLTDLDRISAENDLTIVAAGKGAISSLFERDAARSTHETPPRVLAAVLVTGSNLTGDRPWREIPFRPLRFNFIAGAGEYFSLPFYTHTRGECRSYLFEAVPGGPMDIFQQAKDGAEMLEAVRTCVKRLTPDQAEHVPDDMQLADANAWLKGSFTPTIRKPVGTLPSGRLVFGIGDAVVLNDPIAGQGANNTNRMVKAYLEAIVAHGDKPFDREWMEELFNGFWETSGQYTTAFTNALLKPPTPPIQELLGAASQVQAIADGFCRNFNNPPDFWPALGDLDAARALIAEKTGAAGHGECADVA
ncbi:styrene monooxygenase/indole monooxygenase family protein [Xanthobacter sp. TB0139]|uniref:styrene monooxygenase/indole monooxygenase family protein n=1 Tax=Xanthobacter sp. TB0139 TaxID=3459178 RepID=UPI004039076A